MSPSQSHREGLLSFAREEVAGPRPHNGQVSGPGQSVCPSVSPSFPSALGLLALSSLGILSHGLILSLHYSLHEKPLVFPWKPSWRGCAPFWPFVHGHSLPGAPNLGLATPTPAPTPSPFLGPILGGPGEVIPVLAQ